MSQTPKGLDHARGVIQRCAFWFSAICCLLLLGLAPATAAAEEETHIFNATLSLIGGCAAPETIDPVPDPGCPEGVHPPKRFTKSGAVAVDPSGDRYVASAGSSENGSQGRIDVFGPDGAFITEVEVSLPNFEVSLAVDSLGYLYVGRNDFSDSTVDLLRFAPTKYAPATGEIAYGAAPIVVPNPNPPPLSAPDTWGFSPHPLAIDPTNDHLLVVGNARGADNSQQQAAVEFSSAAEENTYLRTIEFAESTEEGRWVKAFALDAARKRIYVTDLSELATGSAAHPVVRAYNFEAPNELLFTLSGDDTPTERFVSETSNLPLAVDEATGHLFVGDLQAPTRRVYEFDPAGELVSVIGEGLLKATGASLLQLAYDDSPSSPTEGYLFVPSDNAPGRSLAFEPKATTMPPVVESLTVGAVTARDAVLHGKVNPGGVETAYRIEYTTEESFLASGFENSILASEGTIKPASEGITVSASISGLSPGTRYRFRIVADSLEGEDEADVGFTTLPAEEASTGCPNQALRTGPSAALPDCRAYELVTPPDTNGQAPTGTPQGDTFTNRQVSPSGDRLPFMLKGAPLSGLEGTGSFNGDPYLATRTAAGWSPTYQGPSAAFAPEIAPLTSSPDQGYSFWHTDGPLGPAVIARPFTSYLRYPDGHSELLGQGSLGTEYRAVGELISDGGSHIIFSSGFGLGPAVKLEPDAAPDGTTAIYDRTADGVLHVVSLKPGDLPFGPGEKAEVVGAPLDGSAVAFEVESVLYLRFNDSETFEIGEGVQFAGIAEGGGRIFYVQEGDLLAFDVATETKIDFSTSGDVVPVTIAADGTAAYFISPSVLSSSPNPNGEEAMPGEQNLYLSREGQVHFLATVTERDVKGEREGNPLDGLGLWLNANDQQALAKVPARTTPGGDVLVFKSRARLTDYNNGGHAEIYRYDFAAGKLQCISCNLTGATATTDATFQFVAGDELGGMFKDRAWLENLRADGRRAFFETSEQLVAADSDGLSDVYEWEDQGVGSCSAANGCLYLISYGQSARDEHLWAVSRSGDDVFFYSSDLLAGGDVSETPSIYDARVNGGFPSPPAPAGECLGEACQPEAVVPNDPTPASASFEGVGNVAPDGSSRKCPKGEHSARRGAKPRCVRDHKNKRKHHSRKNKHNTNAKGDRRAGR